MRISPSVFDVGGTKRTGGSQADALHIDGGSGRETRAFLRPSKERYILAIPYETTVTALCDQTSRSRERTVSRPSSASGTKLMLYPSTSLPSNDDDEALVKAYQQATPVHKCKARSTSSNHLFSTPSANSIVVVFCPYPPLEESQRRVACRAHKAHE